MNIALFGGSFDPPHLGHLSIADNLIKENYCDTVWFVPCYKHPHLKIISSSAERLMMLKKLSNHSICTYELNKPFPSYSIETLEYFHRTFPLDKFFWVIGSDQLANFDKWYRYQDILDNFKVLVYPRINHSFNKLLPGMHIMTNVEEIDISSSEVKKRVKREQSIDAYTTPGIVEYISLNKLYR